MAATFTERDMFIGAVVRLHPACDLFMRGVRYGSVVRVSSQGVIIEPTVHQDCRFAVSYADIIEVVNR